MPLALDRRRLLSRLAMGLGVASFGIAAVALAQDVILHELVPNLGADEGSTLVSSRGAEPAAIVYGGEILRAPTDGPLERDERAMEAMSGSSGAQDQGLRSQQFHPDRVTALHGAVPYFEVFTPAITPYKRVTSLDGIAIDGDGAPYLVVAHPLRQRLEVEGPGAQPPDGRERDRFWASVVLDFSTGREVPLPSVSPESRILSFRTEPTTPMHVERDGAGNYVAVLEGGAAAGEVRAVFLTDAPRTFFGFDDGQTFAEARADALGDEVMPLPPSVLRDARAFAGELGLSRETPFGEALRELVRHFRSFVESEEPPTNTGNVYLDLSRGMRGVCRHRAYAFVITASALGISSRFVSNEAHAWVEVHLPSHGGWLRVDLGGSAAGLSPRNTESGPTYQPRVDDPFPRPPEYERALAEARGTSLPGAPDGEGGAAGGGGAGGPGGTTADPNAAPGADPSVDPNAPPEPVDPGRPLTMPTTAPRVALALVVDHASEEVFRGQSIEVSGSATSAEGRAPGLRVEVLLRASDGDERLLGVTVTDVNGNFHGSFGVPPDADIGEHALVVRSPGDAHLAAATAE
ncbi:MAG: transglutaminase domain-containing protein [Deltaproteobacteria bacterium]|nr:transglutaminase domain-containing protein [Deltaproteobacteria bacterium]